MEEMAKSKSEMKAELGIHTIADEALKEFVKLKPKCNRESVEARELILKILKAVSNSKGDLILSGKPVRDAKGALKKLLSIEKLYVAAADKYEKQIERLEQPKKHMSPKVKEVQSILTQHVERMHETIGKYSDYVKAISTKHSARKRAAEQKKPKKLSIGAQLRQTLFGAKPKARQQAIRRIETEMPDIETEIPDVKIPRQLRIRRSAAKQKPINKEESNQGLSILSEVSEQTDTLWKKCCESVSQTSKSIESAKKSLSDQEKLISHAEKAEQKLLNLVRRYNETADTYDEQRKKLEKKGIDIPSETKKNQPNTTSQRKMLDSLRKMLSTQVTTLRKNYSEKINKVEQKAAAKQAYNTSKAKVKKCLHQLSELLDKAIKQLDALDHSAQSARDTSNKQALANVKRETTVLYNKTKQKHNDAKKTLRQYTAKRQDYSTCLDSKRTKFNTQQRGEETKYAKILQERTKEFNKLKSKVREIESYRVRKSGIREEMKNALKPGQLSEAPPDDIGRMDGYEYEDDESEEESEKKEVPYRGPTPG